MSKNFPEDFLWGASTSSHQIEGNNYNQWTVWELENAARLAKGAEKRLSWLPSWPDIKDQATDPGNYVSGEGVDHWNRYEHDLDIAKALNLNAFRFSIEWSRIEPSEGKWDEAVIEHYRQYIAAIRKRGMEPILNIWHWTNPVWFEELGAFEKWGNVRYFVRFAATIIEELGPDVKYVIPLNEPNMYSWFGYMDGSWPPAQKSQIKFIKVFLNLARAHRQVYRFAKVHQPDLQISSVPQLVSNVPKDPGNWWHRFGAWTSNIANNWLWLWLTRGTYDFVGFNNYFKNYITGPGTKGIDNPKTPVNDYGWYMEPGSAAEMARVLARRYPSKPIMITENGVADAGDKHRQWWLEETLASLEAARADGVNLIGYMHWSLLDNFEWAEGWWPKFGLVSVDRSKDMKRTVRPSAKWYAKQIAARRSNSVD